jgi:hypothetical protein
LLRFARKIPKNRLKADFLPCKLRKQPDNRGFFAASSAKNPQVQQAARGFAGYFHRRLYIFDPKFLLHKRGK